MSIIIILSLSIRFIAVPSLGLEEYESIETLFLHPPSGKE